MKTIIFFTYQKDEIQNFWKNKLTYSATNKQVFIILVKKDDLDDIMFYFPEKLLTDSSDILILIHTSTGSFKTEVKNHLNEQYQDTDKVIEVGHYNTRRKELTEMRSDNHTLPESDNHTLPEIKSIKPIDILRYGIVENNETIFNEGFEKVWAFFFQVKTKEELLNAKLDLLHNCLIKNDNVKSITNYNKIKDLIVTTKDGNEVSVDDFLDQNFFDPISYYNNLVDLRDSLL